MVRDKTITHAIHEAYRQAALKPRTPEVHLFIELPADRVDVNVHPMKAEVRFLEQSLVHELLRRALAEALGQPSSARFQTGPAQDGVAPPTTPTIPGVVSSSAAASRWAGVTQVFRRQDHPSVADAPGGAVRERVSAEAPPATSDTAMSVGNERSPLIPLGQFRDTFIIAIDNEGVAIIDQHVAHERVLFEQVMSQLTARRARGSAPPDTDGD